MTKFFKWAGIVLGGLIGLTLLVGLVLYPSGIKRFAQSYPNIQVETINIPTDSDAITRGRHIAIIWSCTKCHGENLSGTLLANDPFLGTIPASNLTSGNGGIGKTYTDADWVRAIRHGINSDSRAEIFMYDYYSTMSDRDLGDLIVYLKQIPAADSEYPAMHVGPIIAIAPAIGLFTPAAELIDHDMPHPIFSEPGATIEYGRYLATLCFKCHGSNLASKLKTWKQDDFFRAVQTGVLPNGKHLSPAMPLKTYGEMTDTELTALWLYFMEAKP
jgi:cytochrome c553